VYGLYYVESGPAIYEVYAAGIAREYDIVAGAGEHVVVAFTGKDFVVAAAAFDFVVAAATVEAVIPFGPHERIVAVGAGEDVGQGFLPGEERSETITTITVSKMYSRFIDSLPWSPWCCSSLELIKRYWISVSTPPL
jgi:hypothetical protein